MPTTTPQLIREKQSELIRALSPDQLANTPFREYERLDIFEEWADANPQAAFRRFQILVDGEYTNPLGGDLVSLEMESVFRLTVAYPKTNQYGVDGINGLQDCINQDRRKIVDAIGLNGYGDYVSGHNRTALSSYEIEPGDKVWFMRMTLDINYREAVTSAA